VLMRSAIEKLADREQPMRRRHVVCRRCSVQCSIPLETPLEDVACIGCLRRLATPTTPDGGPPSALATLADWWDKAAAPGPGYGGVECPHCGARCIVEVGSAARTGCVVCLRALGSSPLIRTDLVTRHIARVYEAMDPDEVTETRVRLRDTPCLFFPGEPL
jgi:hypothetical protein